MVSPVSRRVLEISNGSTNPRRRVFLGAFGHDKMRSDGVDAMAFAVFSSKWAFPVACMLRGRIMRFSALRSEHGAISQKMLSSSLKLLEQQGLVERRHYPSIPPRVEYNLTEIGEELIARLLPLGMLIAEARTRAGADHPQKIAQNHHMW